MGVKIKKEKLLEILPENDHSLHFSQYQSNPVIVIYE